MRNLFILCIATGCLSLAACSDQGKAVKGLVYNAAASTGNKYCEVRDEKIVDGLKQRIKEGLENANPKAKFTLKVEVVCD